MYLPHSSNNLDVLKTFSSDQKYWLTLCIKFFVSICISGALFLITILICAKYRKKEAIIENADADKSIRPRLKKSAEQPTKIFKLESAAKRSIVYRAKESVNLNEVKSFCFAKKSAKLVERKSIEVPTEKSTHIQLLNELPEPLHLSTPSPEDIKQVDVVEKFVPTFIYADEFKPPKKKKSDKKLKHAQEITKKLEAPIITKKLEAPKITKKLEAPEITKKLEAAPAEITKKVEPAKPEAEKVPQIIQPFKEGPAAPKVQEVAKKEPPPPAPIREQPRTEEPPKQLGSESFGFRIYDDNVLFNRTPFHAPPSPVVKIVKDGQGVQNAVPKKPIPNKSSVWRPPPDSERTGNTLVQTGKAVSAGRRDYQTLYFVGSEVMKRSEHEEKPKKAA